MIKRDKDEDVFLKQLGKRIAAIRKEKKIRQVDLGYAVDLEKSNMNRIEAGNTNPSILILNKISNHLGVTLSDLFDF